MSYVLIGSTEQNKNGSLRVWFLNHNNYEFVGRMKSVKCLMYSDGQSNNETGFDLNRILSQYDEWNK